MQTLDPATEAGARALDRLEHELMGWLTTVNPDGQPQSSPIWFVWQDGTVRIYSHVRAPRNSNVEGNPHVSFSLNTDRDGDDVLTMEGEARIDLHLPAPSANEAYRAKVGHMVDRYGWTWRWFDEHYPTPIVIAPTRWRLG